MNYRRRLIALLSSILLMICCLTGCSNNKKNEKTKESYEKINEEINNLPKYNFFYTNDTVDIDESVRGLGLDNDHNYPYSTYKVFRFIDFNNEEKFAIVRCNIEFEIDGNNNVTDQIYYYYDVFNGNYVLGTYDRNNINNYYSEYVSYLIEVGDLLDLKKMVISKGLNSEYVDSIMSDDIKNRSLTTEEVARMFVLLVNSNGRLTYNNEAIILQMEG